MSKWVCGPECLFWGDEQKVLTFTVHYCTKKDKPTLKGEECYWTLAEMERDVAETQTVIAARKEAEAK